MATTRASVLRLSSTSTALRHSLPRSSLEDDPVGKVEGPAGLAFPEFPFGDPAEPPLGRIGTRGELTPGHLGDLVGVVDGP